MDLKLTEPPGKEEENKTLIELLRSLVRAIEEGSCQRGPSFMRKISLCTCLKSSWKAAKLKEELVRSDSSN